MTSASLNYTADDVLNPTSGLLGLDLSVSTVNMFMTLIGWSDIFQDLTVLIALIVMGTKAWVQIVILVVFLMDLFSIYVSSFHAPLGIKSVVVEKYVLSALHIMDICFDFGVIAMLIYAGVNFSEDEFLIAIFAVALPVFASNYLALYYTLF